MPKFLLKPKNFSETIWKEYKSSPLTIDAPNSQEARKQASNINLGPQLSGSEKQQFIERSPWLNPSLTDCEESKY